MKRALLLLLCAAVLPAQSGYDLLVYGATAGGVMTAVAAARSGLKVVLVEPGRHIGGMVSGGLSRTDIGRREVIGGLALEFYRRATAHYGAPEISWFVEPHVAEPLFRDLLREAGVTVLLQHRLREKNGVQRRDRVISSIETEDGSHYSAKIFADCSYEGDLMAQSGVSFTWGRESAAQYGESLAGLRSETPKHQFLVDLSPYDGKHKLLPEISDRPVDESGAADRKVQAYNFRLIFSRDPANQLPYPRPAHYDPKRFELLARLLAVKPLHFGDVVSIGPIPNQKADINNNGPVSTDFIGHSWDYPNASYQRRAEIWRDHEEYTKQFFWFLAHDSRIPPELQKEVNQWGPAADEFADTDHWPPQLYIREARRMIGEYVMTQRDIQTDLAKADAIGMGSYNSDSHNVQRIVNAAGFVRNEGDMQVPVKPYQIPYRILLPKRAEAGNLLVPVCFSASHVAYSTLRMEPQYMILGHAAGLAGAIAIRKSVAVQDVDTAELSRILLQQHAILNLKGDQ
jgi:hypothetical protein